MDLQFKSSCFQFNCSKRCLKKSYHYVFCKQELSIYRLSLFPFRANWPPGQPKWPVKVGGQSQVHRRDLKVPPKESKGSTFSWKYQQLWVDYVLNGCYRAKTGQTSTSSYKLVLTIFCSVAIVQYIIDP